MTGDAEHMAGLHFPTSLSSSPLEALDVLDRAGDAVFLVGDHDLVVHANASVQALLDGHARLHRMPIAELMYPDASGELRAGTVARFGGDQFVVLLPSLDTERERAVAQALRVAEKVLQEMGQPYQLKVRGEGGQSTDVEYRCTASIGVTVFTGGDAHTADVLKWADAAMYRAKHAGSNTVRMLGDSPASDAGNAFCRSRCRRS
jgi:hypothetical protein